MITKKIRGYLLVTAFVIFVMDMMVMGLKIFGNDYEVTFEAYLALVCLAVVLICAVFNVIESKCPHCGKWRVTNGAYCSYCGKRFEESDD